MTTDNPTPSGPFVPQGTERLLEDTALELQAALEAFARIRDLAAGITDEELKAAIEEEAYQAGVQVSLNPIYIDRCPDCQIP